MSIRDFILKLDTINRKILQIEFKIVVIKGKEFEVKKMLSEIFNSLDKSEPIIFAKLNALNKKADDVERIVDELNKISDEILSKLQPILDYISKYKHNGVQEQSHEAYEELCNIEKRVPALKENVLCCAYDANEVQCYVTRIKVTLNHVLNVLKK